MMVSRDEYFSVVDFLNGYDCCCGKLDLSYGFHDWLLEKLELGPSGTAWTGLALLLFPEYNVKEDLGRRIFPSRDRIFIERLGSLLIEYWEQKLEDGASRSEGSCVGG
jgi:hypothetical protein